MSTYSACEAALLAHIRAYAGGAVFTAANATRGDFRALDAAGADVACVLVQAAPSACGDNLSGRGAHGQRQQQHTIAAVLARKRGTGDGGDGAGVAALHDLADDLIAWLDSAPRLNGVPVVRRAEVVSMTEPVVRRDSPHVILTLRIVVRTSTTPALIEGAS